MRYRLGAGPEKYGLDDVRQLSKRDFMEWVETPEKGRNASMLLREFEERFARLSALDMTVLDTSRVLLFVKTMDVRYREQVGLLLEMGDRLTGNWVVVKRDCDRFDKWREFGDKSSLGAGSVVARKVEGPVRRLRRPTGQKAEQGG